MAAVRKTEVGLRHYLLSKENLWSSTTKKTAAAKLSHLLSLQLREPLQIFEALKRENKSLYTIKIYLELWKGFEKFTKKRSKVSEFLETHRHVFRNCYKDKERSLRREDYQALLLAASEPGLYNLCLLMGSAGLRLSEALQAEWKDLDQDGVLKVMGKGNKIRFVPTPLEQFKREGLEGETRIAGVNPSYRRLLARFPFTAHDLRAFFATSVSQVLTPFEVMELLGHSDMKTTLKYIRRNNEHIRGKMHAYHQGIHRTVGQTH